MSAHSDVTSIGIDVVDVSGLRVLVEGEGACVLEQLLTERELALCAGRSARYRWYCLAGRIAAKEAVRKALGRIDWLDVEVDRGAEGEPVLAFNRQAEEALRKARFSHVLLSITHDADVALAIVVAS